MYNTYHPIKSSVNVDRYTKLQAAFMSSNANKNIRLIVSVTIIIVGINAIQIAIEVNSSTLILVE